VAHSRQAKKRWRQNVQRRDRNRPVRTRVRTATRSARASIAAGEGGAETVRQAAAIIDRAAKRRVIHRNAAARHKSRLMRLANKLAGDSAAKVEAPKRGRKTAAKPAAKPRAARPAAKPRAPRKKAE
jgi:small subunit ribosomal protein S20